MQFIMILTVGPDWIVFKIQVKGGCNPQPLSKSAPVLCVYIKSCYEETYWAVKQWDDMQLVNIQILSIGYAMTFILL